MADVALPNTDAFLTRKEVRYRLRGMSRTTLWRWEQRGKLRFNARGEIAERKVEEFERWLSRELD